MSRLAEAQARGASGSLLPDDDVGVQMQPVQTRTPTESRVESERKERGEKFSEIVRGMQSFQDHLAQQEKLKNREAQPDPFGVFSSSKHHDKSKLVDAARLNAETYSGATPNAEYFYFSLELRVGKIDSKQSTVRLLGWLHVFFMYSGPRAGSKSKIDDKTKLENVGLKDLGDLTTDIVPIQPGNGGLMFHNSDDIDVLGVDVDISPTTCKDQDTGKDTSLVHLEVQFQGTFKQDWDLRSFPFDRQYLTVRVRLSKDLDNRVRWVPMPTFNSDWAKLLDARELERLQRYRTIDSSEAVRFNVEPGVQGWDFKNVKEQTHLYTKPFGVDSEGLRYPGDPMVFIPMERSSQFYVLSFMIPLFLIVSLSFSSFFVETASQEQFLSQDRAGVTLTLLLAAVAFKFTVTEHIPVTDQQTFLDWYILASILVIGLVAAENWFITAIDLPHHWRVDWIFAASLGGAWLLFHLYLLVVAMVARASGRWWPFHRWKVIRDRALAWHATAFGASRAQDDSIIFAKQMHRHLVKLAEEFHRLMDESEMLSGGRDETELKKLKMEMEHIRKKTATVIATIWNIEFGVFKNYLDWDLTGDPHEIKSSALRKRLVDADQLQKEQLQDDDRVGRPSLSEPAVRSAAPRQGGNAAASGTSLLSQQPSTRKLAKRIRWQAPPSEKDIQRMLVFSLLFYTSKHFNSRSREDAVIALRCLRLAREYASEQGDLPRVKILLEESRACQTLGIVIEEPSQKPENVEGNAPLAAPPSGPKDGQQQQQQPPAAKDKAPVKSEVSVSSFLRQSGSFIATEWMTSLNDEGIRCSEIAANFTGAEELGDDGRKEVEYAFAVLTLQAVWTHEVCVGLENLLREKMIELDPKKMRRKGKTAQKVQKSSKARSQSVGAGAGRDEAGKKEQETRVATASEQDPRSLIRKLERASKRIMALRCGASDRTEEAQELLRKYSESLGNKMKWTDGVPKQCWKYLRGFHRLDFPVRRRYYEGISYESRYRLFRLAYLQFFRGYLTSQQCRSAFPDEAEGQLEARKFSIVNIGDKLESPSAGRSGRDLPDEGIEGSILGPPEAGLDTLLRRGAEMAERQDRPRSADSSDDDDDGRDAVDDYNDYFLRAAEALKDAETIYKEEDQKYGDDPNVKDHNDRDRIKDALEGITDSRIRLERATVEILMFDVQFGALPRLKGDNDSIRVDLDLVEPVEEERIRYQKINSLRLASTLVRRARKHLDALGNEAFVMLEEDYDEEDSDEDDMVDLAYNSWNGEVRVADTEAVEKAIRRRHMSRSGLLSFLCPPAPLTEAEVKRKRSRLNNGVQLFELHAEIYLALKKLGDPKATDFRRYLDYQSSPLARGSSGMAGRAASSSSGSDPDHTAAVSVVPLANPYGRRRHGGRAPAGNP